MKPTRPEDLLVGENAKRGDIDQPWEQDNQAWWDWYVSLADNPAPTVPLRAIPEVNEQVATGLGAIEADLQASYDLSGDDVARFRHEGFVKLPNVLSADACALLRRAMRSSIEHEFNVKLDGGVQARFLSRELMWLHDTILRAYVLSPRIAGIAARLLEVPAVRLYHDNILAKEPGCGRTPWHYDDHHFPLDTQDVVTAWIPAQAIPSDMGPLAFAADIDAHKLVADVPFSKTDTSYDRKVGEIFSARKVPIHDEAFALGEVSFHHNLCFHTAGPNNTRRSRLVLANTYFADGSRVVARPTMVSGDWQKFMPGVGAGEVADSELNPICWPAER
ncbi:MAG: phytanoyl-CoA dioxygenase family protein [Myxococcota bacterium]